MPPLDHHRGSNCSDPRSDYDNAGAATYVCTVIILYGIGAAAIAISRLRPKDRRGEGLDRDATLYLRSQVAVERQTRREKLRHVRRSLPAQLTRSFPASKRRLEESYGATGGGTPEGKARELSSIAEEEKKEREEEL